jgi:hypothetical protein
MALYIGNNANEPTDIYLGSNKIKEIYLGNNLVWPTIKKLDGNYLAVAFGNNIFVAVGDNVASYSTDGISWKKSDSISYSGVFYKIIFANGYFYALSNYSIIKSQDGKTWSGVTLSNAVRDITYGNGKIVVLQNPGTKIYISDGNITQWTQKERNNSFSGDRAIAYGNGKFTTYSGYSTDLETWTSVNVEGNSNISSIIYADNKFVTSAGIYYSTNAIDWKKETGDNMNAMTYGNNKFVGVMAYYVIYSNNTSTWDKSMISNIHTYNSIAYGNNKFVIVGDNKSAYSTNITSWTENI